jgi:hypothetical protein
MGAFAGAVNINLDCRPIMALLPHFLKLRAP